MCACRSLSLVTFHSFSFAYVLASHFHFDGWSLDWLGFDSAKHSILDAMYELHLDRWLFLLLLLVGIVAVHLPIAATFSRYAVFI